MQFTRQKYRYHLYQRVQGLGGLVCTSLDRVTDMRVRVLSLKMLQHLKPQARLCKSLAWIRVLVLQVRLNDTPDVGDSPYLKPLNRLEIT